MTTFPGVAKLNEANVPVIVGLDDERIRLVAGDVSIGEWPVGEYSIIDLGSGTFVIEADEDTIAFHPDDPGGFAQGIAPTRIDVVSGSTATEVRQPTPVADVVEIREGPPPGVKTMVGFYALAALTGVLGVWALLSLIL
ncbi:MAG: hypothetical protein WB245_09925 [Acidimicrobiia bacterium]